MGMSTSEGGGPALDPFRPLPFGGRRDAMNAALARNWWAVALRGLFGIVFGLVALVVPAAAMLSLALVFTAYLLADGIFATVAAVRAAKHHDRWGLLLGEGVLDLAMGVLAALFPAGAVLGFVLVTAAWALLTGSMMLGAAFQLHASNGRLWLALGSIVSLIWGVLLLLAPAAGALVLTWWLGIYAIAFGVALLVLAFRLRRYHESGVTGAAPQGV
jgi:uncharacterized membrane protein HdeD (DUF308 family)